LNILYEVGQREISPKKVQKAATKAPSPILHEIRGFTYTHIQKPFFDYKTVFLKYFCPLGSFFAALLVALDHVKSPGFFPWGLVE
jgi:hypothetical protein